MTAVMGKAYTGSGEPAEIEFINVRRRTVKLYWIGFDGSANFYGLIPSGGEFFQPTYVSHRWLVMREDGQLPIAAYTATRADIHGDGQPQLAMIR